MPFHHTETARSPYKPSLLAIDLLAFIARCCSFDNQHRDRGAGATATGEGKSQTTKEKDVDALTFMRTVMPFVVSGVEEEHVLGIGQNVLRMKLPYMAHNDEVKGVFHGQSD